MLEKAGGSYEGKPKAFIAENAEFAEKESPILSAFGCVGDK
jgi:hypothetical protein